MIQKASNPFQPAPGASPPELVGRSSELAAIWDATERAKSGSVPTPLVFTGLRGIGKTVLLTRLIDSAGAHAVPIRLEVESEVPLSDVVQDAIARLLPTLRSVPKKLLAAVDAALRLVPKLNYELPNELGALSLEAPADDRAPHLPLRTAIESLNAAVSSIGRFLVITIDEIHDADIASLRTIAAGVHQSAASGNPILLACAGLPQTVEVIAKLRTYAHRWDRFELDLLRGPEVAQAIRLPIERNGAIERPSTFSSSSARATRSSSRNMRARPGPHIGADRSRSPMSSASSRAFARESRRRSTATHSTISAPASVCSSSRLRTWAREHTNYARFPARSASDRWHSDRFAPGLSRRASSSRRAPAISNSESPLRSAMLQIIEKRTKRRT